MSGGLGARATGEDMLMTSCWARTRLGAAATGTLRGSLGLEAALLADAGGISRRPACGDSGDGGRTRDDLPPPGAAGFDERLGGGFARERGTE